MCLGGADSIAMQVVAEIQRHGFARIPDKPVVRVKGPHFLYRSEIVFKTKEPSFRLTRGSIAEFFYLRFNPGFMEI